MKKKIVYITGALLLITDKQEVIDEIVDGGFNINEFGVVTTSTEVQPEPEPESIKNKGRKPATDKYNHCERCDAVVKCEPFRADLNVLTGRADYHRQSPRYIKLCSKCSMELSNLVDKWFIDGGGKSKFDRE